jgi:site-specific recombinase XerD
MAAPARRLDDALAKAAAILDGVGEFHMLSHWMTWLRAQGLSDHTLRLYVYGVFRLFLFLDFACPSTVTEEDVVAFLDSELRPRATARVQYVRGIRSAFHYWQRKGWVDHDPTAEIRLRKPRRPPHVALSEEELTRYLVAAAWRSPRRAWTLLLCFAIGARRMEVVGIRPQDIEGSVVHLRDCKYGKDRRVELNAYALAAIEGLRPWWDRTVVGGLRSATVTEWAHQAAQDAGLASKVAHRPAHVLRASFCSHLLAQGVDPVTVRDLMGHENLATTNEYAVVLDPERKRREAVARLNFRGSPADR